MLQFVELPKATAAPALLMVRLLTLNPLPEVMVCSEEPLKLRVPEEKLNVPPLLLQFPAMLCVNEPALKIVPEDKVISPPTEIASPAFTVAVPEIEKSPPTDKGVSGIVLTPLPLSTSLLYPEVDPFGLMIDWPAPLYSIVLSSNAAFSVPLLTSDPAIRMTLPVPGVSPAPVAIVTLQKSVGSAIVAFAFVKITVLVPG